MRWRRRSEVEVRGGVVRDVVCLVRAAPSDWRSRGCGSDCDEARNDPILPVNTSVWYTEIDALT